jgi:inorganic pyrophosphatase
MSVRPVGAFEMRDEKGLDEKILAVPVHDPLYQDYHDLNDVAAHYLREVEHFFAIYKELEGVHTTIQGWRDLARAREIIQSCAELYRTEFGDRAE